MELSSADLKSGCAAFGFFWALHIGRRVRLDWAEPLYTKKDIVICIIVL